MSPDGLTWRLVLRPGILFADGTPLSSADLIRVFNAAISRPAIRDFSVSLADVVSLRPEDDRTIVVSLRRRCAFLLDDLDMRIGKPGANGATIGPGPFSVVSTSANEIVMEANRSYYLGAPAVDRFVLRSYDTLRTAWAEMLRGGVDFLWEIGPDTVEFVEDQPEVRVHSYLNQYVYALVFNSNRPIFRDPRVRRALDRAVDRDALLQQGLRGRGLPADSTVWPRHWTHDRTLGALRHNAAEATALMTEALGGAKRQPGTRPSAPHLQFTCLIPANFAIYERLALLVQQQLWNVNVDMQLESVPADECNARIRKGQFDTTLMNPAGGVYLSFLYRFWHSPDPNPRWNFWGYHDVDVDLALDAARDAPDDRALKAAVARFERAQRENPPALFLLWSETAQAISRRFDVPTEPGRDAFPMLSRAHLVAATGARQ